jgi:catecholate siderophore receptor
MQRVRTGVSSRAKRALTYAAVAGAAGLSLSGAAHAADDIRKVATGEVIATAAEPGDAPDDADQPGRRHHEVEGVDIEGRRHERETVKATAPLENTPQTIQIIDKTLFNQQGATTLTEALRNSPGVGTFYGGENGTTNTGDAVYMRGFDTSNSIFVDGVRDLGSVSRDIFNTDQIEVQKGPAGTDNGRTAPTGAINMVSKRAYLGNLVAGTASVGVDGQRRATIDLNQGLHAFEGGALRLNAVWQDSDVPGRDHVNNKRVGLAPSLALGLHTDTRAFINLLYVKQDNVPDGFVPTIGLPGWTPQPGLAQLAGHPVNSENFYGTRADHDDVTAQMATAIIQHDFANNWTLTNTARWGQTKQDYLLTSYTATGGTVADPLAGNIKWTNINDLSTYTLARSSPTFKDQKNNILTDQINLRGDVLTGTIRHSISTGLELIREKQDTHGVTAAGALAPANLYNPDWNGVGNLSYARNGAGSQGQTDTLGVYLFDTVTLTEKFMVTGGVRFDHYKTDYDATAICGGTGRTIVPCGALPTGSVVTSADLSKKDTLFNWKLGAVYKPVETLSLYANYALSQQPPGGANFALSTSTTSADNPNLDPQKAQTYEAGAKWRVMDGKLNLNAAVYQTSVTNEINANLLDENGNPTQTGKKTVKGVELSAVGYIIPTWSVSAGYSRMKTRVENGALVTADGTANLSYTPDNAFTLWTTYLTPFGATVGGGVTHTGGLHRGTDAAVGTPASTKAWTTVDAIASYPVTKNVTLRVNAYNLFDKNYVQAINKSGYRYTPGRPRTFLFSADYRF